MLPYIAKRVLLFIPTLVLVTLLVFFMMRIMPGDPALLILAGGGDAAFTEEDLAKVRAELGTDRPLYIQYGEWIGSLVRGDMGTALFYGTPVIDEIKQRLPLTFELALLAAILSFIIAVPLGTISAIKQDSVLDYSARIFTFTGISVPIFVVGLLAVYILSDKFGWMPPLKYSDIWNDPWANLQQMIFPALTLAFFQMNFTARVTRSAMLEVMREDYIRTARSKGLKELKVLGVHALKNAMLPIVTVSGWSLGLLLGGTIIIERIFVVPGMGSLLIESITARDYTLIQGVVLIFALLVMAVNLLVDLAYAWLDPRIRYA